MSYQTYSTEAIVCGSVITNTADKSFLLFTKRAGMLYASARSVREERSRQRYALQDFSRLMVSLVRGKTGWRIGSVEAVSNLFSVATTRIERGSIVRIIKLVRRFVQGEEAHPELYDAVIESLNFLMVAHVPHRTLFEILIMTRLLYLLGYIAPPENIVPLLELPLISIDLSEVLSAEAVLVNMLATAETASHL